jgi:hypothetical protein
VDVRDEQPLAIAASWRRAVFVKKTVFVNKTTFVKKQHSLKNSGKQRKTAGRSLLLRTPNQSQPRISAVNKISPAVNLPPEQRKQQKGAGRAVNGQRLCTQTRWY